jgi:hypothetical protein
MTTALATLQVDAPLIDRVIDTAPARPREPDPFPIIEQDLFDRLCRLQPELQEAKDDADAWTVQRANRQALIAAYNYSLAELKSRAGELDRLLAAIIESQVRPIQAAHREASALRGEKIGAMFVKTPRMTVRILDVLRAELMARPEPEVAEVLRSALRSMADDLLRQFAHVLRSWHANGSVGDITWYSTNVCKYHYFEFRRGSRIVSGKTTRREEVRHPNLWVTYEIVSRVVDYEKFDVSTRVEHHLFNAMRHQFPAPRVRRPRHLAPLFAAIPDWLAPHVFIVEGDMLRETFDHGTAKVSSERVGKQDIGQSVVDRRVIQTGINYSPAVTIGSLVVGGWSQADL